MTRSVTVRLAGGLGNQMFQHAAARGIASRLGLDVAHDLRAFARDSQRRPGLQRWQVRAAPASARDLRRYPNTLLRMTWRTGRRLQAVFGMVQEAGFTFDAGIAIIKRPVHLSGYFQSERYFADVRSPLLDEFIPAAPLDGANAELANMLADVRAVSIHVRRGDYLATEINRSIYCSCNPGYYQRAIDCVMALGAVDAWLVFSDDLPWARAHVQPPGPTWYVDGNGVQPEVDIHLMSLCTHNICANSSFSWWGAWLNRHPGKCVIVPSRWFNDAGPDARDLVPEGWTRIAN